MAESITFQFLTRGAEETAGGFKRVGDTAALAARGAKVLQEVIKELGSREDRTAAQSKILAAALRQTGDAEDRAAAKAVLADAAIRRLDDAMKDSSKRSGELGKALGGLKLNPGLLGPAVALAPALATLGGVVTGVAVGLSGAFVAGGAALAAFGAVAKPVLTDAKTAATAVETAQNNYSAAIAGGTKKAVAYKAEQIAIAKAYANLSPAQIVLSKQLGAMANAWDNVKAAETPVVAGALQPWLKSVTSLTGKLAPIIAAVSPYIRDLGTQFDRLVNSGGFTQFRDFVSGAGSAVVGAVGGTLIDFVKAFITLLPQFDPLIAKATRGISDAGAAVLRWSQSKKASDDITKFMAWFSSNGPVVGALLVNIGGALKALAPGLTTGGTTELKLISGFFAFVAKLPPALAKPLAEVAGSLLILNKLGVVNAGVKLTGAAGGAFAKTALGKAILSGAGSLALPVTLTVAAITGLNQIKDKQGGGTLLAPKASDLGFNGSWAHDIAHWYTVMNNEVLAIIGDMTHSILWLFDNNRHSISNILDGLRHDASHYWDVMVGALENAGLGLWKRLLTGFQGLSNGVLNVIGGMIHGLAAAFGWLPFGVGSSLKNAAKNFDGFRAHFNSGINDQIAHISAMQRNINALHGKTVNVILHAAGSGSIYFNETTGVGGSVKGGLKFLAGGGMGPGLAVVGEQGPELVSLPPGSRVYSHGQSKAMIPGIPGFAAGGYVPNYAGAQDWMGGVEAPFGKAVENNYAVRLIGQLKAAVKKAAAAAAGSVAYSRVAGVTQWEGTALRALAMLGLPAADLPTVMAQILTESGGNPNAINLTDINAQQGDPSRGLLQLIGTTFAAYRSPALSSNIYNPLANIYAGLHYAESRYGNPGWLSVLGHGHGYALGTASAAPGWAWVGERGPELLKFRGGEQVRPASVIPAGRSGGAAGQAVQVQLDITGGDQELVALLRKIVRVKGGGNVQAALGR